MSMAIIKYDTLTYTFFDIIHFFWIELNYQSPLGFNRYYYEPINLPF
jgi:hypothetical protein